MPATLSGSAQNMGQSDLRSETISALVRGIVDRMFVMKQVVITEASSSDMETYYTETSTVLTAPTTNIPLQGTPRGSLPTDLTPKFTKKSVTNQAYKGSGVIYWEDERLDKIDVVARTIAKISEAIVSAVDTVIWNTLTENQSAVNINTVAIAAGSEWDSATIAARDPRQNILDAVAEIKKDNWIMGGNLGKIFCIVSPDDAAQIFGNSKVTDAAFAGNDSVMNNGFRGTINGVTILESNVVTADYALVTLYGAGTWYSVQDLIVETKIEPLVSKTVVAAMWGYCALIDPTKSCLISNTQA